MGIEKVNELKGARKERKRKPWAVYDVKMRMGHGRPKVMKVQKVRG